MQKVTNCAFAGKKQANAIAAAQITRYIRRDQVDLTETGSDEDHPDLLKTGSDTDQLAPNASGSDKATSQSIGAR